jgi:hypothetical protein
MNALASTYFAPSEQKLNSGPLIFQWDDRNSRQVEECKKFYQQARREGRYIVDLEGNPVEVFRPGLLGFKVCEAIEIGEFAFRVLDETGDRTVVWNSKDKLQVAEAAALFEKYQKEGYRAYAVSADGKVRRRLLSFDPRAEEIEFEDLNDSRKKRREHINKFVERTPQATLLPKTRPG